MSRITSNKLALPLFSFEDTKYALIKDKKINSLKRSLEEARAKYQLHEKKALTKPTGFYEEKLEGRVAKRKIKSSMILKDFLRLY